MSMFNKKYAWKIWCCLDIKIELQENGKTDLYIASAEGSFEEVRRLVNSENVDIMTVSWRQYDFEFLLRLRNWGPKSTSRNYCEFQLDSTRRHTTKSLHDCCNGG